MLRITGKLTNSLKPKLLVPFIAVLAFVFLGWGSVGHHIINYNTILSALPEMEFFDTWADSLAAHASDADARKSWDPNEAPKHYIDIDNYPEFIANGTIPQDFDSLVALHGYSFVIDQGILPWAIINTADSLESLFEMNDMHQAMLIAADLGHYIADSHMPLHITRNYNGQYTGQYGVHSRYESNLIETFQSQIVYDGDSLQYIENVPDFVFNMIYENYQYVDSVLYADSLAEAYAGNHNSTEYYNKFWEIAKDFTIRLFQKASYRIACVIYTEWVNAAVPVELASFSAKVINNKVKLRWQTATETNNSGFEIQRKDSKSDWIKIGFAEGFGTTSESHQYSFTDSNMLPGTYQYRLKQIDYDGSFEYSDIVEINADVPVQFSLEQNYPNPFNPATTISYQLPYNGFVSLKVYNILGKEVAVLVNKYKTAGSYRVRFDADNLASGIYLYKIKTDSYSEIKKMILLK